MEFKLSVVLLFALMMTGCATSNVPKSFTMDPSSKNGVVIGSITKSRSKQGNQGFLAHVSKLSAHYREIGSDKGAWVGMEKGLFSEFQSSDFKNIDGELFVIELKPGNYEFYTWHVMKGSNVDVSPKHNFSHPFEVIRGKAIYIGEFNLEVLYGDNIFGMGVVSAALFTVKDSFARDIQVLKKDYPKLDDSKISKILASSETASSEGNEKEKSQVLPVQ